MVKCRGWKGQSQAHPGQYQKEEVGWNIIANGMAQKSGLVGGEEAGHQERERRLWVIALLGYHNLRSSYSSKCHSYFNR